MILKIKDELLTKIQNHIGLGVFAIEKAKFEGWLKVELIGSLLSKGYKNVIPEKDRIDITVGKDMAIEIKTINTSYSDYGCSPKIKPITDNVNSVLKDIENLKDKKEYKNRVIIFIVFPVEKSNKFWKKHLLKIQEKVDNIKKYEFEFNFIKGNPGILYIGIL